MKTLRLTRPTIASANGQVVKVGDARYTVPAGLRVINLGELAYLYDEPRGDLYALTALGEVEVPTPLRNLLLLRYFGVTASADSVSHVH